MVFEIFLQINFPYRRIASFENIICKFNIKGFLTCIDAYELNIDLLIISIIIFKMTAYYFLFEILWN